jgi:8-oxo-dGTP pyrophosphatase MutT (NUDIX family)
MKTSFQSNDDYVSFTEELEKRLKKIEPRELVSDDLKRSAVMVLFMNKNNSPHILMTKRSYKVKTHKGQISFPGGGYESEDKDIIETAYRETFEEVGVPKSEINYIGKFDDYVSIYGYHISCFVGSIDYPFNYDFSSDEIDDYVEAPLDIFINLKYDKTSKYEHEGKEYTILYYYYEHQEIWGLTARIMTDFAQKICK